MSTNLISGLSSGFDWRSMIDQLISIERRRVDLVSSNKIKQEKKLAEWQSLNTKLLALKTAASGLKSPPDFNVYKAAMTTDSTSVKGSDLLTATAAATA
ncbi:MAG: flagellar cap protein FliD N-terminal domain-containing protein, partial [Desulfuromonadales bacterium]|nr:flagellar cap protein FliD N-terminal domain-containing protein [Desulfuromonadales bacterium]